ncbi:MAG: hypothetical protein QF489_02180 [Planctomycetota bacterium]|jgi:hypothetical protein|nr:hypothetical protein [Planctomycetota bacterium]
MNHSASAWLQRGLAVWIALAVAATLFAGVRPLGQTAGQSVQSWWTARRYQQADADLDLLGLRDLGQRYLQQTGDGTPLHFAIYQIGFAASGPSMNRLPADALDWARVGADLAHESIGQLPSPWESLQTQAHILVERVFPLSANAQELDLGLTAMEWFLASGGGPSALSNLTGLAYQDYLDLPQAARRTFLLDRMLAESSDESPAQLR